MVNTVQTLYGTFDEKQLKSLKDNIEEIVIGMGRVKAANQSISDIIGLAHEELKIPKKIIRRMAKVQFNQSMQEEVAEFNEFEALLESIKKREVMTNQYSLITTIKYVGGYQLGGVGGLRINFKTKPLWFHRMMMKLCLGWTWVDTK